MEDKDFERWWINSGNVAVVDVDYDECKAAWQAAYKSGRIKALEELLSLPEDEELVGFIDRIEIQKTLERLKNERQRF